MNKAERGQATTRVPDQPGPAIWVRTGLTEHLGGPEATGRLLKLGAVRPEHRVLDLGCGTGHTAWALAWSGQRQVVALDLLAPNLARAGGVAAPDRVAPQFVQADAHALPFAAGHLDRILAESLLIFCRPAAVLAAGYRVLGPAGRLALNELTLAPDAPPALVRLLDRLKIGAQTAAGWQALLAGAGFQVVAVETFPFSLRQQLAGHLARDGWRAYAAGLLRGLKDLALRQLFFNRPMLTALRQFRPYVRVGLYVGLKPDPAAGVGSQSVPRRAAAGRAAPV